MTETQSINLSLTALGDVLSVLSSNANIQSQRLQKSLAPVPYRNSKLTHLLKDSLGGENLAFTCMAYFSFSFSMI